MPINVPHFHAQKGACKRSANRRFTEENEILQRKEAATSELLMPFRSSADKTKLA
jgi:hypothetical protein